MVSTIKAIRNIKDFCFKLNTREIITSVIAKIKVCVCNLESIVAYFIIGAYNLANNKGDAKDDKHESGRSG